jgi:hypothetical protein
MKNPSVNAEGFLLERNFTGFSINDSKVTYISL